MDFADLVELLRNPPEDGNPDTIYDDLSSSYNGVVEGSQARIAEMEAALAERDSTIEGLKSQNYDLLMRVNAEAETLDEPDGNDVEPDVKSEGIDALFDND